MHRLAGDDTGGLHLDTRAARGGDRALAVDRVTEGIDDAAEEGRANRDVDDSAGTLDKIALTNKGIVTENHNTDVVRLEVERHTLKGKGKKKGKRGSAKKEKKIHSITHADARRELHHLLGLDILEAIDTGNTVTNREHAASLVDINASRRAEDALLEDGGNLRLVGGTFKENISEKESETKGGKETAFEVSNIDMNNGKGGQRDEKRTSLEGSSALRESARGGDGHISGEAQRALKNERKKFL